MGYGHRAIALTQLPTPNWQEALADMDRHIKLFPGHDPEAYDLRAWIHDNLGNHEAAERDRRPTATPGPCQDCAVGSGADDLKPKGQCLARRTMMTHPAVASTGTTSPTAVPDHRRCPRAAARQRRNARERGVSWTNRASRAPSAVGPSVGLQLA